jgi:hypothetical protein
MKIKVDKLQINRINAEYNCFYVPTWPNARFLSIVMTAFISHSIFSDPTMSTNGDTNQDSTQHPDTNGRDTPDDHDDIAELFGDETQEEFVEEDDAGDEDLFGDDMER